MEISEYIKKTRAGLELTLQQFAEELSCSVPDNQLSFHYSTISLWENDKRRPEYPDMVVLNDYGLGWPKQFARGLLHLLRPDLWSEPPHSGNGSQPPEQES